MSSQEFCPYTTHCLSMHTVWIAVCPQSSLLAALLGEMRRTAGWLNVEGSVAYVAQQAWMRNMTLRDNVLFGKPFNNQLYTKAPVSQRLSSSVYRYEQRPQ